MCAALRTAGRDDLARKVRWVSEEDGDGAGYDIASFAPDGFPRLIEVKTTNGWERTPFHIHPQRAGRGRGAPVGIAPVPAVEFLTRAEGIRTAPAAGRACLAVRDDVSGELSLKRVLTPAIAVGPALLHKSRWGFIS